MDLITIWWRYDIILKAFWCELLERSSDSAFFLQLCTNSTHVSVLISVNVQNLLSELSFSGTECPPLRRPTASRWKGLVTSTWNALFFSCWITRYHWVTCTSFQPVSLWLIGLPFVPSRRSINWTPAWPVCWVCTHRHVPVSCRLFGFTLKTTSCRTATRKSTSTATVTFDRSAIHRLLLLIIAMSAGCTSIIGSFNKWTVWVFF